MNLVHLYSLMENKTEKNRDDNTGTMIIPVIQEHVTFDKKVVETGKVTISKKVIEEEATLNIPLVQEGYNIERVQVKSKVYDTPPPIKHNGDDMVIPIVKEVAVIIKKYEVVEELHVTKTITEVPQIQQVTLFKEEIEVRREAIDHK